MKSMVIGQPAAPIRASSYYSILFVLLTGCANWRGVYAETPSPSLNPTVTPSLNLTVAPSLRPSSSPSVSVDPTSTPSVSLKPTISSKPSTAPSTSPTSSPTMNPSSLPSISPMPSGRPSVSHAPSQSPSPTISPTAAPTTAPSLFPTPPPQPSVSPSLSFVPTITFSPSAAPSMSIRPSENPSISFVPTDSAAPSTSPSISMKPSLSKSPSVHPSHLPSRMPTTAPSNIPSMMPSTPFPSVLPSLLPTVQPSAMPSSSPSLLPSSTPTRTMTVGISGTIRMTISGIAPLRASNRQKQWESDTSEHVLTFWNQRDTVDIVVASVRTTLTDQIEQNSAGRVRRLSLWNKRYLIDENGGESPVTTFVYNQTVVYSVDHSLDQEGIVQTLTFRPFNHDFQRYADILAGFASVGDDIVYGGISGDPAIEPIPDEGNGGGISGGAIAGAFFGVLFGLLIILGIAYYLWRKQQSKVQKKNSGKYNLEGRHNDLALEPLDLSDPSEPVVIQDESKVSIESDKKNEDIGQQPIVTTSNAKVEPKSENTSNLADNVSDLSIHGLPNILEGQSQPENADINNHEQHNVSFEIPKPDGHDISEAPMTHQLGFGMQISHIDDLEDLE